MHERQHRAGCFRQTDERARVPRTTNGSVLRSGSVDAALIHATHKSEICLKNGSRATKFSVTDSDICRHWLIMI